MRLNDHLSLDRVCLTVIKRQTSLERQ